MLAWILNLGFAAGGSGSPPVQTSPPPNLVYAQGIGTQTFDESVYWSGATSYAIAPALPGAPWGFNTATGVLSIDTSVSATFGPYTITATNASGSTPGSSFTVTVSPSDLWPYRLAGMGEGVRLYQGK